MFMSNVWPAVMVFDVADLANVISSSVKVAVRNIIKLLAETCAKLA